MDSKRGTICSRHTVKDLIEGCELAVEAEDSGIETLICIICFQLCHTTCFNSEVLSYILWIVDGILLIT